MDHRASNCCPDRNWQSITGWFTLCEDMFQGNDDFCASQPGSERPVQHGLPGPTQKGRGQYRTTRTTGYGPHSNTVSVPSSTVIRRIVHSYIKPRPPARLPSDNPCARSAKSGGFFCILASLQVIPFVAAAKVARTGKHRLPKAGRLGPAYRRTQPKTSLDSWTQLPPAPVYGGLVGMRCMSTTRVLLN
jgi:hypothetical protein